MNYYITFFIIALLAVGFVIFNVKTNEKVKGNVNSRNEKIYYTKEHRLYYSVDAEKMFRNVKKAEKAGYRLPKR